MDAKRASVLLFTIGLLGGAIAFGIGFEFRSGQTDEPVYASVSKANPSAAGSTSAAEPPSQELARQTSITSILADGSGNLLPTFIAKVEPAVVEINCYSIRNRIFSSGSGISFRNDPPDGYKIYTNYHVYAAAYLNGKPPICFAVFPQPPNYSYNTSYGDYVIKLVDSHYDPKTNEDRAVFSLGEPLPTATPLYPIPVINDAYIALGITHHMCSATDPGVGDSVTIFGYPRSGNALGISETVTVGIISGVLPGPVYKTTAAIDHGNSGGIAILNKNGCSLGMPTLGASGLTGGIGYIQSFILASKS